MIRKLLLLAVLVLVHALPANAAIVMRLYAKNYVYFTSDGFPHAFVGFSGTKADGTVVNEAWGFYPNPGPNAGVWDWLAGVPGQVSPDQDAIAHAKAYLEVPISDQKFSEMQQIRDRWDSKDSYYQPALSNCIDFVNAIAGAAGLIVPQDGNTSFDPSLYMKGLAILNPQYIAGSTYSLAELEKYLEGSEARGAATYSGTISDTNYGKAIDHQWLTAEYYRRAAEQKQQTSRETSRKSVLSRYSASNYSSAVAQAKANSSQAAAVQASIDDFENQVRGGSTPTIGGTWSWGTDAGTGGAGGVGVGSGAGSGTPSHAPSPGTCYFIECMRTNVPAPHLTPSQAPRAIGPTAVRVATTTAGSIAAPAPMLAFEISGVAAPSSSRQIIHLGNVLPGDHLTAGVDMSIVGADAGQFAIFASGNVQFKVPAATDMPANVVSLKRGYAAKRLDIETTVPLKPLQPGQTAVADRVWVTQGGAIVAEVYLTYDVYPADHLSAKIDSGRLASGFGEEWGPEYCLCSGLPPIAFAFNNISYDMHNVTTNHPRTCTSGWATCTPFVGSGDDGHCVKFQAQGHEKRDKPFDDDVGITGIDFEASATVTFVLSRPKPRWVEASEIDTGS